MLISPSLAYSEYPKALLNSSGLRVFSADVDKFSAYNRAHGYEAGDAVLSVLRQKLSDAGCTVVISGKDSWGFTSLPLAEIGARLNSVVSTFQLETGLSVTIGLVSGMRADDPQLALDRACDALSEGKSSGGNRVVYAKGDGVPG